MGSQVNRRLGRRALSVVAAVATATIVLAGCASGGDNEENGQAPKDRDGVPVVSVWAWYPKFKDIVKKFNETHNDVHIKWTNAGVSGDVYAKLRTALEAGSGAPDVTQMEFSELPAFQVMDKLVDIGPLGANEVKKNYPEWAWNQVSDGKAVYGIPVDAGPIVTFYRQDLFQQYGLTVPKTWEEFRAAAQKVKQQNPDVWITDFLVGNASNLVGLIQQAGGEPYHYSFSEPNKISIDFNSATTKKVLNYWGDMIDDGLVDHEAYHSTEVDNKLASGKYLSTLEAAWRPGYLGNVAKSTSGKWRVAPLPQWKAGDDLQGNHGGSTFAVTTQAKDKKLAAKVAIELFGSEDLWKIGIDEAFLFPVWQPIATSDWFLDKKYEFFGGQQINHVIVPIENNVSPLQFTPFDSYAKNVINEQVAKAADGKQTMDKAADTIQSLLVKHAKSLGMTVE